MTPRFRIAAGFAELRWGYFLDAPQILKEHRPNSLFIEGDWNEERLEPSDVDSVTSLKIGTQDYRFLLVEKFTNLVNLEILSKPRQKHDFCGNFSPVLSSLSTTWLGDATIKLVAARSLTRAALQGVPEMALKEFSENPCIKSLKISQSKIASLAGIDRFRNLSSLELVLCSKLNSIEGLSCSAIEELRIENAKSLASVEVISTLTRLQSLVLISTAPSIDLKPIALRGSIRRLQVGGERMPILDWDSALRIAEIEKIFAWWNPAAISREQLEDIAASAGKRLLRFEGQGKEGRIQVLFLELGKL